jgi:hypothetical protein
MHQHLQQGLVANAFSRREFACFCYIGFWQSQRYLNARCPIQLTN